MPSCLGFAMLYSKHRCSRSGPAHGITMLVTSVCLVGVLLVSQTGIAEPDLIGNDINYAVSCSVYEQLGRPERLQPSFLQKEKVQTGKLGRKTGEGYYTYEG